MTENHRHIYKKPQAGDVYKFCKCGKRRKIVQLKKQRAKLFRTAENLWREIAHKRDGEKCQILKVFPELKLNHSWVMQVDHFFPRADKNLFFEPSNATVLCSTCNYLKSNGSPQSTKINIAVKEIVLRREGQKKFDEMFHINNAGMPNREFKKEFYLESVIGRLRAHLASLETSEETAA